MQAFGDPVPAYRRRSRPGRDPFVPREPIGAPLQGPRTDGDGYRAASAWLVAWDKALEESDIAFAEVERARKARQNHVGLGRDAEADWVEVMVRLRR